MKKLSLVISLLLCVVVNATISNTNRKVSYDIDATSEFTYAYTFDVIDAATVYLTFYDTDGEEVVVVMTRTTSSSPAANEYYVNTDSSQVLIGGTSTLQAQYDSDITQLLIYREVESTQEEAFPTSTPLQTDSIETGLDKNVMIIQQLEEELDRHYSIPIQDVAARVAALELPAAASRASKFFAFDASGDPVMTVGTTTDALNFSEEHNTDGTHEDITADSFKTVSPWIDITHPDYGAVADSDGAGAGTDNYATIQAAITAAGDDGVVYFPAGRYRILTELTVANSNVTLRGEGNATIIDQDNCGGVTLTTTASPVVNSDDVTIRDMHWNLWDNGRDYKGIFVDGVNSANRIFNTRILNCKFTGHSTSINLNWAETPIVNNCTTDSQVAGNNPLNFLKIDGTGHDAKVVNSDIRGYNNSTDTSATNVGILFASDSGNHEGTLIADNVIYNFYRGIISGGIGTTIRNNELWAIGSVGIQWGSSQWLSICNNTIELSTAAAVTNAECILLTPPGSAVKTHNIISHNILVGNSVATCTGISIGNNLRLMDISSNNIFQCILYGIDIGVGTATDQAISVQGNVIDSNSVTPIRSADTTGFVRDNIGWVTENSGTATLLNANTSVTVAHGLAATPTVINIAWRENPTNVIADWWVDTIGATTFKLNGVNPGVSNLDFGWEAKVR